MNNTNKFNVGDDNTFYGNTVINQPMAVGRNAKAGSGSIAIGANAVAGSDIFLLLNKLKKSIAQQSDTADIEDLVRELKKQSPDKTLVGRIWSGIKAVKWTGESVALIIQISQILDKIIF
ncbi:MAG: hypothetical protein NTV72_00125 [Candidatus Taylorbacteria bacterium]|nr:hypothetical protein [Candidatus Taylorbacteria bacterium]